MKSPALIPLALIPVALLAACQKADNQPGPGGVTVGEARALEQAAEMIESEAPPAPEPQTTAPAPARQGPPGLTSAGR